MAEHWGRNRTGTPVTLRDVAERLGISHSTVSRALAGHPAISPDTKARVRSMAAALGYVPNASARTMRGARSALAGLVIPDIQNDFYATVAKLLADVLASHGLQLVLCVTEDDPEREFRELRALHEIRAAGVLITPSAAPRPETLALLRAMQPVQLVRTGASLDADAVVIDDRAGIGAAIRHLVDNGHRRIAYIGGTTDLSTGRERLAGCEEALRARRLEPAFVALGPPRPEFARHAIASLLGASERPTGLVLGSSELTLGALQGLRAAGLRWPRDISVVGHGDPAWYALAEGGITAVSLPVADIARTAASLLLSRIEHRSPGEGAAGAVSAFAPALVLRGSTAALRED
jgi:LacI family transcriptional regulator